MTPNQTAFTDNLEKAYSELFTTDPEYAFSASRGTPKQLALRMMHALKNGSGNKEGKGIKYACKQAGIKQTNKAITEFLNA